MSIVSFFFSLVVFVFVFVFMLLPYPLELCRYLWDDNNNISHDIFLSVQQTTYRIGNRILLGMTAGRPR